MPEARKFVFPRPDESTSLQPTSGEAEHADVEKGGVDDTAEVVEVQEEVEGKKSCESAEGGRRRGSTVAVGRWPSRQ